MAVKSGYFVRDVGTRKHITEHIQDADLGYNFTILRSVQDHDAPNDF